MSKLHSAKKSPAGAPGAKALITTASLAITLGGWAAFTRANGDTIDTASPASAIALPRPSTDLKLAPQLLPTIVPAPPPPPDLAIAHPPLIPAALLSDSAPVAAQAAAPRPRADAPAVAQPAAPAAPPAAIQLPAVNAPPLRTVSAPPQPVARTRSSN
jgi:hypothetical protein